MKFFCHRLAICHAEKNAGRVSYCFATNETEVTALKSGTLNKYQDNRIHLIRCSGRAQLAMPVKEK